MLKVGSKFYTFDELSRRLEEFQELEQVQLWVRDSRTVVAAAKRARRKSLNPALKYAELTYSCVFGGRRPSDQTKTHNQTSAGGCPFKVRLSTSNDGQALVVKEICHDHNHEPGKKLHEEPRRLYKKTTNRTTVRKPVRYIVNKQRVTSSTGGKSKGRQESESHIQLGQSPFHHLHLHQQQYQQQQQQIKLQLQHHLQQQQQQQQQLRQKQAEVIQLDSPDHIDTPDHLSSPDLSNTFDQLGSLNNSVDQYTYLPPSPISPSLSSGCPVDCEEEERLEPILDLEEALEEALGDLDSVSSMEVDANLRLTSVGSTNPPHVSHSEAASPDEHTGPPPAKRQRGRPRKQSFTGTPPKGEKAEKSDQTGERKDEDSDEKEEDFLGFSPSVDKNKPEIALVSRAEVAQANAMARQLHVYKPGIDFVPGARLEVLDTRDNNWYQCKVVEVDWGELDILVHYERWSNRFDEWLKMDSTRIRPVVRSSSRKSKKGGTFRIGDKVTARWAADGKRYQARVTKVLGDDQYEVLFFDGVTKVVRSGALSKCELKSPRVGENQTEGDDVSSESGSPRKQSIGEDEELMLLSPAGTTASSTDSRPSSPEPDQTLGEGVKAEELSEMEAVTTPVRKSIFEVEIIEQKRKPKRKAAVEELFQSLKKKRRYEYHGKKDETSPKVQHAQRPPQMKKVPPSKKRGRDSMGIYDEEGPVAGTSRSWELTHDVTESSSCESPMPSQSMNTVLVDIEDGWKKCCTRRTHGTTAGKWDMFYITPEGKKIRSKNDLHRYFEDSGLPLDIEKFDFSVKNMKDVIEAHLQEMELKESQRASATSKDVKETPKEIKDNPVVEVKEEMKDIKEEETSDEVPGGSVSKDPPASVKKPDIKKTETKHSESKTGEATRVKIEIPIMPKTEPLGTLASSLLSPSASPWPSSVSHGSSRILPPAPPSFEASLEPTADQSTVTGTQVSSQTTVLDQGPILTTSTPTSIAGPSKPAAAAPPRAKQTVKKEPVLAPNEFVVRTEHNEHQCPKSGCGKSFRKENLLQMHIKHYHPEILKKSSSWAPNVADLAYARTVGDHLDLTASPTHSSPPVEKILKGEASSKKSNRGSISGSPGELKVKGVDKKSVATVGGLSAQITTPKQPKEPKKKELLKQENTVAGASDGLVLKSEDEVEVKEELEDYIDDLEDGTSLGISKSQDPDYDPHEGIDQVQKKKDKKEKSKSKLDSKAKKRKSVPSESMSEDDQLEPKSVTKYRYSKRKGSSSTPKITADSVVSDAINSNASGKKLQYIEESSGIDVEEDTTDTWVDGSENVSVQEAPAEIINCGCGSTEEEGLMLQCDVCLCWQHGACYNILGEEQVPDKYICSLCDHPRQERSSHKFRHHQDWLKEGRLPRFSFSRTRGDARLEACVRRGNELTANVLQLSQVLHSLRLKLHIAKEADHPKFVMWHKKWDEKKEGMGQSEKAGTSTDADTITPLPADLMDIVGQDGSTLNPQTLNNSISETSLNTDIPNPVSMSQPGLVGTPNTGTHMELGLPTTPTSGVWGLTGDMTNGQQISEQSFVGADASADFIKKEEEGDLPSETSQNRKEIGSEDNADDFSTSESQVTLQPEVKESSGTEEVTTTNKEENIPSKFEDPSTSSAKEDTEQEEIDKKQETIETAVEKDKDKTDETVRDTEALPEDKAEETTATSLSENLAMDSEKMEDIKENNKDETLSSEPSDLSGAAENSKIVQPDSCHSGLAQEPEKENAVSGRQTDIDTSLENQGLDAEDQGTDQMPLQEKEPENVESNEEKNVRNTQSENSNSETRDEKLHSKESSDTQETKLVEDRKVESEETSEKDLTGNIEDIELSQTEDIVPPDLPQAEEIEAPGDVLDDDDTQLDDGDDLAAALLSSQTELEQLVTQASSALSPHVPTPSLEAPVVAPIIPEAERIEPVNCKLNLLEHVQVMQGNITKRFDEIEKQLEVLEAEMGLSGDTGNDDGEEDSEERDPATLQARALVKLILNDINTVKKIAEFTH